MRRTASVERSSTYREYDVHEELFETSLLLSLPKELRIGMSTFALTEPSMPLLTLHIRREQTSRRTLGKQSPHALHGNKYAEKTEVETTFENTKHSTIHVNLLQTSHLIYDEALPILYHSIVFYIQDLKSTFPMFLDRISPCAKSRIRHVKLSHYEPFWSDTSSFY